MQLLLPLRLLRRRRNDNRIRNNHQKHSNWLQSWAQLNQASQSTQWCVEIRNSQNEKDELNAAQTHYLDQEPKIFGGRVLLDSGSTITTICDKSLLKNIRFEFKPIAMSTNVGTKVIDKSGELEGFGRVWYDPNGRVNILSLRYVKQRYRVTYNSEVDVFHVHLPAGVVKFQGTDNGLYPGSVSNFCSAMTTNSSLGFTKWEQEKVQEDEFTVKDGTILADSDILTGVDAVDNDQNKDDKDNTVDNDRDSEEDEQLDEEIDRDLHDLPGQEQRIMVKDDTKDGDEEEEQADNEVEEEDEEQVEDDVLQQEQEQVEDQDTTTEEDEAASNVSAPQRSERIASLDPIVYKVKLQQQSIPIQAGQMKIQVPKPKTEEGQERV